VVKVCEYVAPGAMSPLSKSVPVTVCVTESLFVHMTVSPVLTVTLIGANAMLTILTAAANDDGSELVDGVVVDVGVGVELAQPAAANNATRANTAAQSRAVSSCPTSWDESATDGCLSGEYSLITGDVSHPASLGGQHWLTRIGYISVGSSATRRRLGTSDADA
jgi:hypothetical protein